MLNGNVTQGHEGDLLEWGARQVLNELGIDKDTQDRLIAAGVIKEG